MDQKRERKSGGEQRGRPAEPAKVHGDILDDLIPRDLREVDESARDEEAARGPRTKKAGEP